MFLNHVARWTNETFIALSESPADTIMTIKGRVLQNRAYYEFFSTCDKDVKAAAAKAEAEPMPTPD